MKEHPRPGATGGTPRTRRKGVTFAAARRILLAFPGVEEGPCYGTPGFRVRGKFLARIKEDGRTLIVKCGDDERDVRMQLDPGTYFITDHYRGYPTVLVNLDRAGADDLRDLLEITWRRSAPKTLIAPYDGGEKSRASTASMASRPRKAPSPTRSITRAATRRRDRGTGR